MGLGANEKQRALIVGSDAFKTLQCPPKNAIVIDGPCACRKYMTRTVSATTIVKMALKSILATFDLDTEKPGDLCVAVLFDRNEFMPPQRAAVAASRKPSIPTEIDVGLYNLETDTPGHLRQAVPWDAVLNKGGKFKRCGWRIFSQAWYQELVRLQTFKSILIVGPDFSFQFGPHFSGYEMPKFGEADLCVAHVARHLERKMLKTVVFTIDYDMLLQALLLFSTHPQHDTHVCYPGAVHNVSSLCRRYGPSMEKRWTSALILVTTFKTDYSSPCCRQVKMKSTDLIASMKIDAAETCPFDFSNDGTINFNLRKYARLFRNTPYVADMVKHLWTLFYFGFMHGEALEIKEGDITFGQKLMIINTIKL